MVQAGGDFRKGEEREIDGDRWRDKIREKSSEREEERPTLRYAD